jgi:hypothetical protein
MIEHYSKQILVVSLPVVVAAAAKPMLHDG